MTICNICGGEEFLPGPNGRMARSGKLPCCAGCQSLERHRGLRALLAGFPGDFFAARRGVQFAPDRAPDASLDAVWFTSLEHIILPTDTSSLTHIPVADGGADFLSLSHMLEFEVDDRAAFAELLRVLSASGVLHAAFTSATSAPATTQFTPPKPPYGRHWDYGQDIVDRFALRENGLHGVMVTLADLVTETSEPTWFFCRRAEDAKLIARAAGAALVREV